MRGDGSFDTGGFDAPLRTHERRCQRTALSLIASVALALSIMVTVTVMSMGMAHAGLLVAMQKGDGSLAIGSLIISLVAGLVVGAIYRRRQQPY